MEIHRRLEIFLERWRTAPACHTAEEALALVCGLIEEVEDEFSPGPREEPPPMHVTEHPANSAPSLLAGHPCYRPRKLCWKNREQPMNTPSELQDLVAEIVRSYPGAQLDFDPLPSGVCFLWGTLGQRNFVIEYSPSQGTGVSENRPNTPPFVGHDMAFASLAEGVARFRELLRRAGELTGSVSAAA